LGGHGDAMGGPWGIPGGSLGVLGCFLGALKNTKKNVSFCCISNLGAVLNDTWGAQTPRDPQSIARERHGNTGKPTAVRPRPPDKLQKLPRRPRPSQESQRARPGSPGAVSGGADAPCAASGALKTNVFSTAPMEPSDPPNASKGCPRAPRRPKRSLPWLQAAPLGAEESKPGRSRPLPGAPKRTLGGHKKSHEPPKDDLSCSQSATESVQSEQEKR